jgi:hypothetical protein
VRFHAAPSKDRLALAGTIAGLLAPVDWPLAWEDARMHLIQGLTALLVEMSEDTPGNLLHVIDLDLDLDLYHAGCFQLARARDFLYTPCRRDALREVARLCVVGNFWCWRALGRAVVRSRERAASEPVDNARRRHAIAFETYAEGARAMNEACGVVLFGALDLGNRLWLSELM